LEMPSIHRGGPDKIASHTPEKRWDTASEVWTLKDENWKGRHQDVPFEKGAPPRLEIPKEEPAGSAEQNRRCYWADTMVNCVRFSWPVFAYSHWFFLLMQRLSLLLHSVWLSGSPFLHCGRNISLLFG
jgi:hypothetical protein